MLLFFKKTAGRYLAFCKVRKSIKHIRIIKEAILLFRIEGNVENFYSRVGEVINDVSLSTVHLFAFLDHSEEKVNMSSKYFLNESTKNYINYLRKKYGENDMDIRDGVDVMIEYIKNFGYELEEGEHLLQS